MGRACMLASMLVVVLAPRAMAQAIDRAGAYRAAVDAYRAGDFDAAAGAIAGWSSSDSRRAALPLTTDRTEWRRAEAAAMLHTDFILELRAATNDAIEQHVSMAEAIVRALAPPEGATADVAPHGDCQMIARALAALIPVGAAASIAASAQQPTFRSGVDLVRLDVSVTRGGQPVRDLTRVILRSSIAAFRSASRASARATSCRSA